MGITDLYGHIVAGLVAAEYVLELLPSNGALGVRRPLPVESSGRLQDELRLVAEKVQRVRVLGAERAPVGKAFVVAGDGGGRRAWAQADADGYATLRGLSAQSVRIEEARSAQQVALKIVEVGADGETLTVLTAP